MRTPLLGTNSTRILPEPVHNGFESVIGTYQAASVDVAIDTTTPGIDGDGASGSS